MKLLDLFCGAGGAGEGYRRAGFEVTGVDIRPMPNNPHTFVQADALEYLFDHGHEFDAIHASPPCQAHTSLNKMWNAKKHQDMIPATREALERSGKLWVIENVERSTLRSPLKLCGTMFGLGIADAELRRHRLFETNFGLIPPTPCRHGTKPRVIGVYGGHGRDKRRFKNTQNFPTEARREAMGIDWMTGKELNQAIPPAYTEFVGRELMKHLSSLRPPAIRPSFARQGFFVR